MSEIGQWVEKRATGLATAMAFYGKIGFWVQLVFLIAVALLGIYTVSIGSNADLTNVMSFLLLGLPIFTTFWCYRYGVVGRKWVDGEISPTPGGLSRMTWIGVWAGAAGALASLLSLFGAASTLMVTMLANPQVGLQIAAATGETSSYNVSAIDAVSIMALLLTLTAELLVVAFSLRLLFMVVGATRMPQSS